MSIWHLDEILDQKQCGVMAGAEAFGQTVFGLSYHSSN